MNRSHTRRRPVEEREFHARLRGLQSRMMRFFLLALVSAVAAAWDSPAALLHRLADSTADVERLCLADFQKICVKHDHDGKRRLSSSRVHGRRRRLQRQAVDDIAVTVPAYTKERPEDSAAQVSESVDGPSDSGMEVEDAKPASDVDEGVEENDGKIPWVSDDDDTVSAYTREWPEEATTQGSESVDGRSDSGMEVENAEQASDVDGGVEDDYSTWGSVDTSNDGAEDLKNVEWERQREFSLVLLFRQFLPWAVVEAPEPCDMDADMGMDMNIDEPDWSFDRFASYGYENQVDPPELPIEAQPDMVDWDWDVVEPSVSTVSWVKNDGATPIKTVDDYMCLYKHMDKVENEDCHEALVLAKSDYDECVNHGLFAPPHGYGDGEDFLIVLLAFSLIAFAAVAYRKRSKRAAKELAQSAEKLKGNAYASPSSHEMEEQPRKCRTLCRIFALTLISFPMVLALSKIGRKLAHHHHDMDEDHHHAHPVFVGLFLFCGTMLVVLGVRLLLLPMVCSRSNESEREGYPGTSHYMRIEEQSLEKEGSLSSKTVTAELVDDEDRV